MSLQDVKNQLYVVASFNIIIRASHFKYKLLLTALIGLQHGLGLREMG